MSHVEWHHGEPAPDPFDAAAGDHTLYTVHHCLASDHEGDEAEIFESVLVPALKAANAVTRAEARVVLFELDPVYSVITIVTTDRARRRDEHHVYKVTFSDWHRPPIAPVPGVEGVEANDDGEDVVHEALHALEARMRGLLVEVARRPAVSALVAGLVGRGFEFFVTHPESDEPWEPAPIGPAPDNMVPFRRR